jgi:flavin-dependent dehydrogenase
VKVLVLGAGIGGLGAAIALRQRGSDVDLVEIRPHLSVYGIGINQPANSLRALLKPAAPVQGARMSGGRPSGTRGPARGHGHAGPRRAGSTPGRPRVRARIREGFGYEREQS